MMGRTPATWAGAASRRVGRTISAGRGDYLVSYAYDDGNVSGTAAKYVHLTQVTYPGGLRGVLQLRDHRHRGGGRATDNIATDGSGGGQLAQYTYLGAGTIVQVDHPRSPGASTLTYKGAAGKYPGFDRVGRVVWQKWTGTGRTGCMDRYFYGYDKGSNRVWRAERQVWHESTNSMAANGMRGTSTTVSAA